MLNLNLQANNNDLLHRREMPNRNKYHNNASHASTWMTRNRCKISCSDKLREEVITESNISFQMQESKDGNYRKLVSYHLVSRAFKINTELLWIKIRGKFTDQILPRHLNQALLTN